MPCTLKPHIYLSRGKWLYKSAARIYVTTPQGQLRTMNMMRKLDVLDQLAYLFTLEQNYKRS